MTLTTRIVLAMIGGILGGALIKLTHDSGILGSTGDLILYDLLANGIFDIVGQIFIASLRLAIVPLVFFSLVCGVLSISSSSQIGTITIKTLSLYLVTTAIAISLALFFALLVEPGLGANLALPQAFVATDPPSLKQVLVSIFPTK